MVSGGRNALRDSTVRCRNWSRRHLRGLCTPRKVRARPFHSLHRYRILKSLLVRPSAPFFENNRRTHTLVNEDGSATTHIVVSCSLEDISNATALRAQDAAFALKECGLLQRRKRRDMGGDEDVICVSREMVEAVAKARGVKKNMMELNHVML
jgi:hypothetical protein